MILHCSAANGTTNQFTNTRVERDLVMDPYSMYGVLCLRPPSLIDMTVAYFCGSTETRRLSRAPNVSAQLSSGIRDERPAVGGCAPHRLGHRVPHRVALA